MLHPVAARSARHAEGRHRPDGPHTTPSASRRLRAAQLLSLALVVTACSGVAPLSPATDAWLGRWPGVEGSFLQIDGGRGVYRVTVHDLDGPRRFAGTARADGGIEFQRDGLHETLRATDGAGTGMKWLAERRHCLVIRRGEGFCRD